VIRLRRDAFNFRRRQKFSNNDGIIELAPDVFGVLIVGADGNDASTSAYWALSWIDVEEERWPVVVEHVIVVGILLIVQCDFHYGLPQHI
jgi:hypothetical protein